MSRILWMALLVLNACALPASESGVANTIDCSSYIEEIDQLPESAIPVLGRVAFPTAPVETGRAGDEGSPYAGYRFAKFGLLVRVDQKLVLQVPHTGAVLMEWGRMEQPRRPATRLWIGPCPGAGTEWLAFAGGLWVQEPMCVPITVTSDGKQGQAWVGVDTGCP